MPLYRCFVTRHYIAVRFFDIESTGAKQAARDAEKAAKVLFPDVRAKAVDNGWIRDKDSETTIPYLGYSAAPFKTKEVFKTKKSTLYMDVRTNEETI